jgi:tRNA (mo5U34)-methyltransferase
MNSRPENLLPDPTRTLSAATPCYRTEIKRLIQSSRQQVQLPAYDSYWAHLQSLQQEFRAPAVLKQRDRMVSVELLHGEPVDSEKLKKAFFDFKPWRKGPFDVHQVSLEAEWDSDLKWQRLAPQLGGQWGKKILDVGCNNGYYLLRAAQEDPAWALGIDPTPRFYLQWKLLTMGLKLPRVEFQMLGIEHLHAFPSVFDTILCMGIVYHHPDPIGQLQCLRKSLRPGGTLVLEGMGLDSPDSICLFPEVRYAKAPGVWFLPSASCMKNWLVRSGFKDVEIIDSRKTTVHEQRNSPYCPRPFETLSDFLDPNNDELTVEGYPAPFRHMIVAR